MTERDPPILLFPTHYLGNFTLGLPWVCQVLRAHPDALVVLDSRFAELAAMVLPERVNLLLYHRDRLASSQPFRTRLAHYWQFLRGLRRYRHGTLMDLEGERFTGVLSRLSGCQRRIGPRGKRAEYFYTDILDLDYRRHRFNAFGDVVADFIADGKPASRLAYRVPNAVSRALDARLAALFGEQINERFSERFSERFTRQLVSHKSLVAIHPGASVSYKLWPQDYFVELVRGLEARDFQVLWVGAGQLDQEIVDAVMAQLPGSSALSLCNQLDFCSLVALFQRCHCFVGSDSGPMHLAASTGLPVLALFGPSVEAIWAPLGDNSRVLRGSKACGKDCDAWHCEFSYHCLTSLSPDQVLDAVLQHARAPAVTGGSRPGPDA